MRENRTSGSEGAEPVKSRLPYPYQSLFAQGPQPALTQSPIFVQQKPGRYPH